MFSPEKQCRYRKRSTGNLSGQWDAHHFPWILIMLNTWTFWLGLRCKARVHDHPLWYWPCWSCEDHAWPEIRSECLSILTGIAHAAQVIARVSEMLTISHDSSSCWTLERGGLDWDEMIVFTITHYDTGQADLVRIMLDLRFEVNAFPSYPVSHTQHKF